MDKIVNLHQNNVKFNGKNIMTNNKEIKDTIVPSEEFNKFFESTVGIYLQSKLIRKIASCASETQGKIKRIGDTGFCEGQHMAEFLSLKKIGEVKLALQRVDKKNSLIDYDYKIFEDDFLRCYIIAQLPEKQNFADYTDWYKMEEIDKKERENLYTNVAKLAEQGITVHPHDIFYNPKTKDFKIMSFERISTKGFYDYDEKDDYLTFFTEFCKLKDNE